MLSQGRSSTISTMLPVLYRLIVSWWLFASTSHFTPSPRCHLMLVHQQWLYANTPSGWPAQPLPELSHLKIIVMDDCIWRWVMGDMMRCRDEWWWDDRIIATGLCVSVSDMPLLTFAICEEMTIEGCGQSNRSGWKWTSEGLRDIS